MDVPQTLVLTTSLGGFDKPLEHEPQSVKCDFYRYDEPLRYNAMTPRLQAKIPKFFAWQLKSGYNYYVWLDGNLRFSHPEALKYLLEQIEGYDMVVLKHPRRDTVYWEYRYNWRGLNNNKPSRYLQSRYTNELLDEQYQVIKDDPEFRDDLLVNGGVFMYRNKPEVQAELKEWWYHVSRYLIMDQLAFAYLIKTSGLNVRILPDDFSNTWWLENGRHAK